MSFQVTINGIKTMHNEKIRIIDLIDDKEKRYFSAKVNNYKRDLSYELDEDCVVELLDISTANKIYETSLRYLLAMAFKIVYPELKVRFSYNVSRSIFIEVLNGKQKADLKMVEAVSNKMKELVELDYPLVRTSVSKEQALEVYEKDGDYDKIEALKYRPEQKVHLYECNGYKNYMYGRMVPSLGYLKYFKLRLYSPGIIMQYPRKETKGAIPPFMDAPQFGKALREGKRWSLVTGGDTVAGINQAIKRDGSIEYINVCEARHNRMLCELGHKIEQEIRDIRLICVAGPSSSGKTTFANRLRIELLSRGIKPIRISLDDYYLSREQYPLDEKGNPDYEHIDALDIKLFNRNMVDLINGEEVTLPKFNFVTGKREVGRTIKLEEDEPIIIEGIHALNDKLTHEIPRHQKFKIYISPQAQINLDNHNPLSLTDLRLLRRIVRDFNFRGSSAEETIDMWPNVRKGEFKWIYDFQEDADYVYNSLLNYEICAMKKYAMPVLNKIGKESPFYTTAERLVRMLKYFDEIDDKWIPNNSLIREFIGGSCYADV